MPHTPDDHGRRVSAGALARMTPEQRHQRARVAALARHHPEVRRDLRVATTEQYIRDLVDSWPPLTDAQRGRLAALLAGTGEADASPAPE
jgi:hypothetical protein